MYETGLAAVLTWAWRTRLWTFAEEYLSRKLKIIFKGQICTLRRGEIVYQGQYGVPQHMGIVLKRARGLADESFCNSNYGKPAYTNVLDRSAPGMGHLLSAIRHRKTTKADDETIVLATLLYLPTSTLTSATGEERTARFYDLLKHVPKAWLFFDVGRLSIPFFQWARAMAG